MFKKAERKQTYMKIALVGVSGCGKTYSALLLAQGLGNKIAMIDTENGSGSLYSNICNYDVCSIEPPFTVDKYIKAIEEAEKAGYGVLIIDSLSHAWASEGGILEQVDKKAAISKSGNSYTAWRDVTPQHNKLVSAILQSKMDIIVTMRAKTAYEIETNDKGKKVPVKRGLAPIQRDGLEYEFTVVFDIDKEKHYAEAGKDRTGLFDGTINIITVDTGKKIREWVNEGVAIVPDDEPAEPLKEPTEEPKPRIIKVDGTTKLLTQSGYVSIATIDKEKLRKMYDSGFYKEANAEIEKALGTLSKSDQDILDNI